MKVIIHGATGRMGHMVSSMAEKGFAGAEVAALVSPSIAEGGAEHAYTALEHFQGEADCVIDFSSHTALAALLTYCVERRLPTVIATTGYTEAERKMIEKASLEIPIFFSANMSIGIALLAELAQKAAATFPQADIEIVEKHHNQKLDVPSGTALLLAQSIQTVRADSELVIGRHENGKRGRQEIGIHSLRLGNEVGTHEIIISTGNETITLKHEAENRALFAEGALRAAAFLCAKPAGLYSMEDMIS